MNALANKEVGDYLNNHFVSSYQKVGTFKIVNGQKQGGNVASYFCTADGNILDAIAGPVDAATLLREARWVVETRKMALLESHGDVKKYKTFFRVAHAERLPATGTLPQVDWPRLPLMQPSPEALTALLDRTPGAGQLDKQGRVHLLLAAYPLVPLSQAYKVVYDQIVGEKVSALPVAVRDAGSPGSPGLGNTATNSAIRNYFRAPVMEGQAMPTPEELRELARQREVNHALNDPSAPEVYSGNVLNVLLADLLRRPEQAGNGATRINPEVLSRINVTPVVNGASFGLLRDGAELEWPAAWQIAPLARLSLELRRSVERSVAEARNQARKGRVSAGFIAGLRADIKDLDAFLARNVCSVQAADYIEAKRHLKQLDAAVQLLGRKDAGSYLDGTYALDPAKVHTVPELVAFMRDHGLTFAAAVEGDESAYTALHRALTEYERQFQVETPTPVSEGAL